MELHRCAGNAFEGFEKGEKKGKPEFSDKVLETANNFIQFCLMHLEEGDFREEWRAFTPEEQEAFYLALIDGFNDSTKE